MVEFVKPRSATSWGISTVLIGNYFAQQVSYSYILLLIVLQLYLKQTTIFPKFKVYDNFWTLIIQVYGCQLWKCNHNYQTFPLVIGLLETLLSLLKKQEK